MRLAGCARQALRSYTPEMECVIGQFPVILTPHRAKRGAAEDRLSLHSRGWGRMNWMAAPQSSGRMLRHARRHSFRRCLRH